MSGVVYVPRDAMAVCGEPGEALALLFLCLRHEKSRGQPFRVSTRELQARSGKSARWAKSFLQRMEDFDALTIVERGNQRSATLVQVQAPLGTNGDVHIAHHSRPAVKPPRGSSRSGWVYFARSGDAVKIGFTSKDPVKRVQSSSWLEGYQDSLIPHHRSVANGLLEGESAAFAAGSPDRSWQADSLNLSVSDPWVTLAWVDREDGANRLYYGFGDGAGLWGGPSMVVRHRGMARTADLNTAIVRNLLFAAWTDYREGSGDIYFYSQEMGWPGTRSVAEGCSLGCGSTANLSPRG